MKTELVANILYFLFMPDDIDTGMITDDETLDVYDVVYLTKNGKTKSVVILDCDKVIPTVAILENNAIFTDCKDYIAFIPMKKFKLSPSNWRDYSNIFYAQETDMQPEDFQRQLRL